MKGALCRGGPFGGPLGRYRVRLNRVVHIQPPAVAAAAAAARSRAAAVAAAATAPAATAFPLLVSRPHEKEDQDLNRRGPPVVGPLFRTCPEGPFWSIRGVASLPLCCGSSRRVAHLADAAAAMEAAADEGGGRGASARIVTFSDMLEEEDSLSGLSDVYNNQRTLGSLLTRAQMHHQRERARRIEKERISRLGLRLTLSRRFAAIAALLTNTPSLHVDINRFCDSLETLVFAQGPPAGPLNPRDRSRIRGLLEETFAEMQTSGNDIADPFDLILGLCHFCRSDDDERVKVLLTPYVADMFRQARVTFSSHQQLQQQQQQQQLLLLQLCPREVEVDDLAVASAIEIFKAKYPFLSAGERREKGNVSATAATATAAATPAAAAAAAAACAQNKLFIDLTEEPWKSVACHAGLELSYEDFVRVCQDTPKIASMTQACLLRLPLIVTLRDLIDVDPAF
ncbi:hypothetical protein ACSSS7_003094 [Eimeria intestinalis]